MENVFFHDSLYVYLLTLNVFDYFCVANQLPANVN